MLALDAASGNGLYGLRLLNASFERDQCAIAWRTCAISDEETEPALAAGCLNQEEAALGTNAAKTNPAIKNTLKS